MTRQHTSILELRAHVRTPEQWSGALDAHPYIIDRTTDPLEQWTQFCMAYISDIAQSNAEILPLALSDVFGTIKNIALYSFKPILIDDLDARSQQSVSRILSHIGKHMEVLAPRKQRGCIPEFPSFHDPCHEKCTLTCFVDGTA